MSKILNKNVIYTKASKVKVVEVEKANIKALVDSKRAFEGSMISIKHPEL